MYKLIEGHWPYNIEEQTRGMSFEEKISEYKKIHQSGQINFSGLTPNDIRDIIKKGMRPNPKERYQDIKEFILDLISFYNSEKKLKENEIEKLKTLLEEKRREMIEIEKTIERIQNELKNSTDTKETEKIAKNDSGDLEE